MAYVNMMFDVMAALKERRSKAEAKVARAIKSLESAQKELEDVAAAERVMADITGESVEVRPSAGGTSERDREIAKLLGVGPDDAKSPAELYPLYVAEHGESLNLDAFRTALWRLQKKVLQGSEKSWTVKSENGRYWRMAFKNEMGELAELIGGGDEP